MELTPAGTLNPLTGEWSVVQALVMSILLDSRFSETQSALSRRKKDEEGGKRGQQHVWGEEKVTGDLVVLILQNSVVLEKMVTVRFVVSGEGRVLLSSW
jgi:hypothetical protein